MNFINFKNFLLVKILFLNYEYPPLGGGAGNATFYLLREFAKITDLEIDLVTSSIDDSYHFEKVGENIKIHRLPIGKNKTNLHFQSQKDLLVYAWKAYIFSRKLAKNNKYDLSHSFFAVPCGFLSLLFKWRCKISYIVSLRGADVPGYSERFTFVYKILTPLIKVIWSRAGNVVSNSQGLRELALKSKPKQKIEVIYNGVDIEEFKPAAAAPGYEFQILCVSRLTKRKGIKYVIDAVKKLSEKYPRIKLKIVGEGNAKKELIKQAQELLIEDRVEFTGLIPHDKLPEVYNSAQVFVLPSLNEGMSNTMLEAIAAGLPIIATDTGGTQELLKENINGFIVEPRNSEDIAKKIEALLTDNELRRKMALESRRRAERFSWKSVADKYLELYKNINSARQ